MCNRYTRVFSASSESFDPQTWPDNLAWGGTSRYTITMSRLVIPHCRRSAWNSGLALTAASLSAISSATMLDRTPGMGCHELIVPWLRDNGFVDSSCVAIQQYRKCLSLNWVAWGEVENHVFGRFIQDGCGKAWLGTQVARVWTIATTVLTSSTLRGSRGWSPSWVELHLISGESTIVTPKSKNGKYDYKILHILHADWLWIPAPLKSRWGILILNSSVY